MKIDFTGKKAIVCGGSKGIGRAIALGLAREGVKVAIAARRERSDGGGAGTGIRPSRDMREHPRKLENTEGVRVHHAEGARR